MFGCFLLVVCFLLYRETQNFFQFPGLVASPALWPQIVIGVLAFLSCALIISSLRAHFREAKGNKEKSINFNLGALFASINKKVVLALALTFAFLFAFRHLGFVITILIYYLALTMILAPTKNIKTIAIRAGQSIVLVVAIYLVFLRGLNVLLPIGPFPAYWFY